MITAKQFRRCVPSALAYKIKRNEAGAIDCRIAILSNDGERIELHNNGYLWYESPYDRAQSQYTGTNDIKAIKQTVRRYV